MSARGQALADALAADPAGVKARVLAERARRSGSRSFAAFVKQAWPEVDSNPLIWGPHLQALSDHLEAAARGQIPRLLCNLPPRHGKSLVFSVMWPAWIWTWRLSAKFIYLSYSDDLVVEHSTKCRALVESDWYRRTFGAGWKLRSYQNTKHDFEITSGGRRIAASIKAGVTGRGADYVCGDDPLSVEEAASAVARETATNVFKQAASTRLDDPTSGVVALVMHRVHIEDPSAWAIESGYEHLCMPAEYDPELPHATRRIVDGKSEEFWSDHRTEPGELLFPERFTREVLARVRAGLGSVAYAAQFGQRPVRGGRAGQYFRREWFTAVEVAPVDVDKRVRRWDLASTEGRGLLTTNDSDWTVGVLLSRSHARRFCVENVKRLQAGPRAVRDLVKATAEADGPLVEIVVPQDPGQAGKDQAQEYATMLQGYTIHTPRETGDKVVRAGPASAQAQAGNISYVRAPWNEEFFAVLEGFPDPGMHDDDADALAGAVTAIALPPKSTFELWGDADLA